MEKWPRILFVVIGAGMVWTGAGGDTPFSNNSPPVLWLERAWLVRTSEAVGAVVTRVSASDTERDPLVFGLDRAEGLSSFRRDQPLPFRIDPHSGVVTVNDTLLPWAGANLTLYVTASDGEITVKTEVFAQIRNESSEEDVGGGPGRGPGRGPPRPPHDPRAPFSPPSLGVPGLPRPPRPGPPPLPPLTPNVVPGFKPRVTPAPGAAGPPFGSAVFATSPLGRGVAGRGTSSSISGEGVYWTSSAPEDASPATAPPSSPSSPDPPSSPSSSTLPPSSSANSTTSTAGPAGPDLSTTVAPIAAVCAVFLLAGSALWLFRRRLCRLGPKNKDEMQRKESGPGPGLVLEEPMALHHWRGPRAHSNRYEACEGDAAFQQQQNATTKLADRWEFPRHRLKVFNILGEGCFGQVWRCEALDIDGLEGPTVVAVKTLKESATERERADLLQELQVMKSLDPHPNVVRLLGCCTDKDPLFLIMEYVTLGKLQSVLRSSRAERCYGNLHGASSSLTSRDLTSFVYQVARGMDFLSSKGIIHRDLAARNVLVGDGHVCKVADFGFARDVIASHVYERKSEGRLPIRWMAPESLYDNIFSAKSDVWSFGVLMWEVVTLGSTPYPGLAAADVMKRVRDGHRLEKPEHCRRELYNIMYYCWDKDSVERPTFRELVGLLEPLLVAETDYIELERFPDHSYYNMLSLSDEKL